MRHDIDMEGLTTKVFSANYRHPGQTYSASIQNNTAQVLTITVTNQNILKDTSAAYSEPAQGPLVVAVGEVEMLSDPYVGLLLTLAGAGAAGETIDIVEAG